MRKTPLLFAGLLLISAAISGLSAAPTVTAVANAASNIPAGMPIAQGSIFIIKGRGLGPDNISISPAAFQSTTLSGTSVTVTVGTTTVNAPLYYTSASQVAALLPSNTPTGSGSFTVTYNGQASNPAGHGISAGSLGIFTIDSSGTGPGIVTYPDYSLVSAAKATPCGGPNTACGAANAGDTLILWGTGLGAVSGNDASGAGLGQAMPNVPLTLWLGGVQAPVVYKGRSGCCIGEDQIVFTVPSNVPTGCAVPLVVQIGGAFGNSTVMPVARGSRDCTPTNPAFASINLEREVMAGPVTYGFMSLEKDPNSNGPGYQDSLGFEFARIPSYAPGTQPFFASWIDDGPPGTCIGFSGLSGGGGEDPPTGDPVPLDAGSSFTVTGPSGSVSVKGNPGSGGGTLSAAGTFLAGGVTYTITGTGGTDVGPLSASITMPAAPTLVTPGDNASVARSSGLTVTWTGGGSGNVQILIYSAFDNTFTNGFRAVCTAPASSGTFTIPPYVLQALPAGNFGGIVISPASVSVPFVATGLNLAFLTTSQYGTGFGYGAGHGSFALK